MPAWGQLQTVQVNLEPPLARITLVRPEKLNALSQAVLGDLDQAFEALRGRPEVRAVVLTGAGDKAFAAGADIAELAALDPAAAREASARGQALLLKIERFPAPVIAAIHGFALGGGLELALACTLRLASDNARLGQPEVKLGLIPGYGGTQRLTRLIGLGPALRMLLTGEPVSAAEALRLGLVNQITPPAELGAAATALARQIAANAPQAVHLCKQAALAGSDMALERGLELESGLFALCFSTAEMKEGTCAFLEKRAPRFGQP